ncbi:DcaP family trimeric outer membrane transporter [Namhaeicola litoreus]|uniref:DcaP family trimeric outer membrane transporter n=1 Tax=Namhaeicola litoreus TaxID=1052145 RepID=A0ABW3Y0Z6_9FLAO
MLIKKIKLLIILFILVASKGQLHAQDLDSIKAEIKMLKEYTQRINELEKYIDQIESDSSSTHLQQVKAAQSDTLGDQILVIPKEDMREPNPVITGSDLVNDDFKGSWPMFGSDFRMKIGGYLKVDILYDFNGTTDKTQFLMSTIPVKGTPEYADDGYINFMARETRFNFDVRRTSGKVPLRLFIEGDFWSAGNQLRLRHAYVVAGDFIVGQTWTTLSYLESLVTLIDFAAGDALFGGRTTLVRYQKKINEHWKVAAGIENLDFLGIENPDMVGGKSSLQLPLLAFRADYSWKTGLLIMGASFAQLHWDGGAEGPDASALQNDFVVGGRQYIGKSDYFTWNFSYGNGSGENIMAFAGSDANAVINIDGKLETLPAYSLLLGFSHEWSDKFTSNLSVAYGWLESKESRDPLALKQGGIGHLNLIYRPLKNFTCGIEFMYGNQETTDGSIGRANRLQTMAKYQF